MTPFPFQRLRLGHIDLIQCHDIEFGNLDTIISETLPALQTLKRQGKVTSLAEAGGRADGRLYADADAAGRHAHS